jgi:hypothetical protein
VVLVVDDVDVLVELVDVDEREVEEVDDDEVDVGEAVEDELLDDVDVVVAIVVGGWAVLVVVGGGGADELVLDVDDVVSVVDVTVAPIVLDVLVDVDTCCAGRVVLVVVEARGRLVDVVLVTTGYAGQLAGAEALRAANRRGSSRFTDGPPNIMQ